VLPSYRDVARYLSGTFVADLPGVYFVHRALVGVLRTADAILDLPWSLTDGERWLTYNGAALFVDTSDHVAGKLRRNGEYEPEIRAAIERFLEPGDRAIDAGAHVGHHGVTMRQCVGEGGEVLLFEPNPVNAGYIRRSIEENGWDNVKLFEVGLSDSASTETLVVTSATSTAGSFLKERNTTSLTAMRDASTSYDVETRRLRDVLAEEGVEEVDLVKIDVEGSETEIVSDLQGELDTIETILLEFHTHKIPDADVEMAYEILAESGELTDLDGEPMTLESVARSKTTVVWHLK